MKSKYYNIKRIDFVFMNSAIAQFLTFTLKLNVNKLSHIKKPEPIKNDNNNIIKQVKNTEY